MKNKSHFISFGVMLQLVQVLSCTIPEWMVDTWNDEFTDGEATITSSGLLTWHELEIYGQPDEYTCVDFDTDVLVWRTVERDRYQNYIYACMMYRGYDSKKNQFYYYFLSERPNPNEDGGSMPRLVFSEDDNLMKCDVCSTTEGRDVTENYRMSKNSVFSTVDQPTFGQDVKCPLGCEENLTVYKTLLTNIIQKILTKGIKCDDHGNVYNKGNVQGGFERSACKCLQKLNKDLVDVEGSECNEFLLSQK